jgi:hypothetical protein
VQGTLFLSNSGSEPLHLVGLGRACNFHPIRFERSTLNPGEVASFEVLVKQPSLGSESYPIQTLFVSDEKNTSGIPLRIRFQHPQ